MVAEVTNSADHIVDVIRYAEAASCNIHCSEKRLTEMARDLKEAVAWFKVA
jgi:hypothetical protein